MAEHAGPKITRDQLVEAIVTLGLDPRRVSRLVIEPGELLVTYRTQASDYPPGPRPLDVTERWLIGSLPSVHE